MAFEDEDISSCSENWDSSDEEEEKKKVVAAPPPKTKGKKGLAAKIKEREEREKKEKQMREMTPSERRAAEKEAVEKSALSDAQELTDVTDADSIDLGKFVPKTKYEFEKYSEILTKKLTSLQGSAFYTEFLCSITREMIKPLKLDDTRKVEKVLSVQINELVKSSKPKKKGGKKGVSLNSGGGKGGLDTNAYDDMDDMEDLM